MMQDVDQKSFNVQMECVSQDVGYVMETTTVGTTRMNRTVVELPQHQYHQVYFRATVTINPLSCFFVTCFVGCNWWHILNYRKNVILFH